MRDELIRLRAMTDNLLPAPTSPEVESLEQVLGLALPDAVAAIYADHGGMKAEPWWAMRLLAPTEAAETISVLRTVQLPILDDELGVFWTDDSSNYAGVFACGPLEGRVFIIDHDEPSPAPVFMSVESFYRAMLDTAELAPADEWVDWSALAADYPRMTTSSPSRPDDDELARTLLADYWIHLADDEPAAYQGIALSSPDDNHLLVELLSTDDMWITEAAAKLLGQRRWTPAVPALAQLARSDLHNGKIAALRALKAIGDGPARRELELLRRELPESYQRLAH